MRSVFFGVFQSFVVLLYILDNETNFVVQVSVFIGVLIDLWKITKVMDVRVRPGCYTAAGAPQGWERGRTAQPDPGAGPGGFPVPAALPRPRGFSHQGIFRVTHGAGELGAVGKVRGWSWLGGGGRAGASTAAGRSLPACLQLDREHKVAGLLPRPTFQDKSTYVESSTKVYDDVSVPLPSRPQGGSPGTRSLLGAPALHSGGLGCLPVGRQPLALGLVSFPPVSSVCHIDFLAESSSQSHLEIPPGWPAKPGVGGWRRGARLPGGAQGATSQPHPVPCRWRSGTCPGSSSRCWAAMPSTASCTWSTRAGTPGCSACSTASC